MIIANDVDSDPVGSAFIWVPGSGSKGMKLREKQSLTKKIWGFFWGGNYILSATKKLAYLKGLGRDLKIFFILDF